MSRTVHPEGGVHGGADQPYGILCFITKKTIILLKSLNFDITNALMLSPLTSAVYIVALSAECSSCYISSIN